MIYYHKDLNPCPAQLQELLHLEWVIGQLKSKQVYGVKFATTHLYLESGLDVERLLWLQSLTHNHFIFCYYFLQRRFI